MWTRGGVVTEALQAQNRKRTDARIWSVATYLVHAINCIVRDVDLGRDEEVGDVRIVRNAERRPIDVADPRNCVA